MILDKTHCRRALTRGRTTAAIGLVSVLALTLATAQTSPPSRLIVPQDVKTLQYQVREIGQSAGGEDKYSLNDRGEVAGLIWEPEGKKRGQQTQFGIVWTPEQPHFRLGASPEQDCYIPKVINNNGQIIGQKIGKNGSLNWFLGTREALTPFRATPEFQQLTAAGFQLSELSDINDADWLLINAHRQKMWDQALVWHDNRLVQLKPLPDAHLAYAGASALNNSGWAAGASDGQAVLWKGDTPLGLGVLPGYVASEATGLNDRGDVIGKLFRKEDSGVSTFVYGKASHAFVWLNGKMQDLGNLPDRQYAAPVGINDAGQIVGNSWSVQPAHIPHYPTAYSVSSSAFLWQNGKIYDLQQFLPANSPWRLESACALNNQGQIVAIALDESLPFSEWRERVVLLTPK